MPKVSERFIVPELFKELPQLVAGVSTRRCGFSPAPFESLNLGKSTNDDPLLVSKNLTALCEDLGILPSQLARAYQCHGDRIWHATEGTYVENYDAIIASKPGVIAGVNIADCCPILVVDPKQKVTAAIHAGWKGTVAKIVEKTVAAMLETYHCQADDLLAWIGPCISVKHFEVGDEVAEHFAANEKVKMGAKYHVDLKQANFHQLKKIGVGKVEISEHCTVEHNELFFSHRKEQGTTGRMMAFAGFTINR